MTPEDLSTFFKARLPAAIGHLEQLVSINSWTRNGPGVNEVGKLTAGLFAPMGFEAETIPAEDPEFGSHLFLKRRGTPGGPTVIFVGHLDTVYPPGEEARHDFRWQLAGDRIFGPGTTDIKGGTVMMYLTLLGLAEASPASFGKTNWLLAFNAAEEEILASADFATHVQRLVSDDENVEACLVFESGGWSGDDDASGGKSFSVVTSRKGRLIFHLHARGRNAHAGSFHQQGASAIAQLAEVIPGALALTDYERGLTCNIGTLSGGTALNTIPDSARASGEARAFDPALLDEAATALRKLHGISTIRSGDRKHAARIEVEIVGTVNPMPENPEALSLAEHWKAAAQTMGYSLHLESRGGLSDANYLYKSFPTLDGMGPHGFNIHCASRSPERDGSPASEPESVCVGSFVPRATLNTLSLLSLLSPAA